MSTISKAQLKARLLELLREVEATGEELVITNHGKPVLKIVPVEASASVDAVFGDVRGALAFGGDPDAPTSDEWGAV